MPRQPRRKSNSNVYHIMLRGINRQSIFECDEDYQHFLELLRQYKEKCGYRVYAYCLMGNHVHLLMSFDKEDISISMKRICVAYSYYYNYKNMREGHVFQDRFRSEAVEDDPYFIGVARYIHRNPLKAGICSSLKKYQWSSYFEYLKATGKDKNVKPSVYITDTSMILDMQGSDEFFRFTNTANDDDYLELHDEPRVAISDETARSVLKKAVGIDTVTFVQSMTKPKQHEVINLLYDSGANASQISRLTGISRPTIIKVINQYKEF